MIKLYINFLILLFIGTAQAASDELLVASDGISKTFSISQLRKFKSYKNLAVKNRKPVKNRTYEVVQVSDLFDKKTWNKTQYIQFVALDGMTVTMAKERLGSSSKVSQAWLAFNPIKKGWPTTRSGASYGPFYLVWENPKKSGVKPEEWPFQVTKIQAQTKSIAELYSKLQPQKGAKGNVRKGYQVFLKNCFPCHTINKQGPAEFGPDLNFPHNPTEYWQKDMLVKYIRNPRSIRHWPKSRMPSFNKKEIADKELEKLIEYLKHMATSR